MLGAKWRQLEMIVCNKGSSHAKQCTVGHDLVKLLQPGKSVSYNDIIFQF